MINDKMESLSSRTTCSKDNCFVEENSSCKASVLKNDRHHNDNNTLPLNVVCRLSMSPALWQNRQVDESSVSADVETSQSCQTSPERKFDPFAARLDDSKLAPEGSYVPPRWQTLNHDLESESEENIGTDSADDLDTEDCFSELLFNSLLELIISSKLIEMSVTNRAEDPDQAAECKTPTHSLLLTGIAETCPPAPMRRTLFVKGFDHSICRKLDFENS